MVMFHCYVKLPEGMFLSLKNTQEHVHLGFSFLRRHGSEWLKDLTACALLHPCAMCQIKGSLRHGGSQLLTRGLYPPTKVGYSGLYHDIRPLTT